MTTPNSQLPRLTQKNSTRILLALDSLSESRNLASSPNQTDFNLMKSTLLADYSLELFCPAICDHMGLVVVPSDKKPSTLTPNLNTYLDAIYSHTSEDTLIHHLTSRAKIVHEKRNGVQHDGIALSQSTTIRLYSDVEEYLNQISIKFLGCEIKDVNITISIEDLDTRKTMESALARLKSRDYNNTALLIAEAFYSFEESVFMNNNDLISRDMGKVTAFREQLVEVYIKRHMYGMSSYADESARKSIDALAKVMHFQQFDISVMDSMRFITLLPQMERSPMSTKYFSLGESRDYSQGDVNFLLDISIRLIWKIQSSVSKLRNTQPVTSFGLSGRPV